MSGYSADLAYIHDVGHSAFCQQAAPELLRLIQTAKPRGTVVDLGCGGGHWAQHLVEGGFDVLGVDISPGMIRLARRRLAAWSNGDANGRRARANPAGRARFRLGSFLEVSLPRCVAVTSIGECLGYLFDPQQGKPALEHLFARVHAALEPGGLFIFDLLEPLSAGRTRQGKSWASGPDWAVLVARHEDPPNQRLVREIISFRQIGLWRRTEEVHRVALLERNFVRRALRRQGFLVRVISGYGELRFERGHVGFVARKPVHERARRQR